MRRQWRVLATFTLYVLGLQSAVLSVHCQLPQMDMSIKLPASGVAAAEEYLLKSINEERAAAGLRAVRFDQSLQVAAQGHAFEMARLSTLSHRLQGEADLTARGSSAGARFSRITENVAVGPSIVTMHGALMQSPHHRENILDEQVDTIGIAVVQANGSLWAVEDFSRKVEQLSLDEQESRVADVLRALQVNAAPTPAARVTCGLTSGFAGSRPAFTMRYTTGDLTRMPEPLRARLQSSAIRSAAVGACTSENDKGSFASYNIAVVVYR